MKEANRCSAVLLLNGTVVRTQLWLQGPGECTKRLGGCKSRRSGASTCLMGVYSGSDEPALAASKVNRRATSRTRCAPPHQQSTHLLIYATNDSKTYIFCMEVREGLPPRRRSAGTRLTQVATTSEYAIVSVSIGVIKVEAPLPDVSNHVKESELVWELTPDVAKLIP